MYDLSQIYQAYAIVQEFFGSGSPSGYIVTLLQITYTFFNGVFLKKSYLSADSKNCNFNNIMTLSDNSKLFSIKSFAQKYGGLVMIVSYLSLQSNILAHRTQYTRSSVLISCDCTLYPYASRTFDIAHEPLAGSNMVHDSEILSRSFFVTHCGV